MLSSTEKLVASGAGSPWQVEIYTRQNNFSCVQNQQSLICEYLAAEQELLLFLYHIMKHITYISVFIKWKSKVVDIRVRTQSPDTSIHFPFVRLNGIQPYIGNPAALAEQPNAQPIVLLVSKRRLNVMPSIEQVADKFSGCDAQQEAISAQLLRVYTSTSIQNTALTYTRILISLYNATNTL